MGKIKEIWLEKLYNQEPDCQENDNENLNKNNDIKNTTNKMGRN